jgi:hypothetical protein
MIFVSFGGAPERDWGAANWVGHRLFDDMAALAPNDPQVAKALLVADSHHILRLDDEKRARNPELVERLEALLKRVVRATRSTTEDSHLLRWRERLEPEWRESYLRAMRRLAALLEAEEEYRRQARNESPEP